MGDDSIPFVLVGVVTSWEPSSRVLWVGHECLHIPPSVPTQLLTGWTPYLTEALRVRIVGSRPRDGAEPWTVAAIGRHEPGF